jgi:hypothetical protein
MEEVQKQKEMKQRLDSMRDEFKEFQKDYSQNTDSAIYEELPLAPDWIESSFSFYLGETPAIQHKTLYRVFERCKTDLGITTNRALRDRLLQSKAGFARDLRQCCWQALHGTDGVTRWFSEIGGKDSLLVRANFWDNLRQDCGSENSPKLKDYAKKLVERSMPWVTLDPRVQFDKIPFVVYLILPRAEPQNAEYKRAFEDAVSSLLRGISPLSDLYVGLGTESSEVTCYADIWALIPAAFKTLHNASGLAARFQACVAKSGAKDPDSFLHTDVDTVQFADLMVTSPQDAEGVFEAWKLFLLAIMLRVIMSSPNYSKPKRDEAQRLSPTFSFSYVSAGSKTQRQLGQYQAAVSTIQRDPHVRSQLQDMVNAQFIGQSASRYERLLGLARYYKQCIFPIRQPANGDRAVATPPYIALTNIEGECLTSWKNARLGGSPSIYETERELVARGPAQLLWSLRKYAGHTGGTDEGAALKLGMPATDDKGNFNYLEHPPKDGGYDEGDSVEIAISRLDKLKNQVFELLPPDLAQNGALREQNRYFPWLALGQWREVYLPSKHGQTPPDRNAPAAIRRQKTDEMTSAEIVEHFRNVPSDGATRSGGALIWMPDGNHSDWDYWYHNPALVALVTSARLTLPEYGATTPSTPAVPAAASVPAVPGVPAVPAAEPPLQYAVAGGQPETLVAADIAARVLANPSASHYVLVHNAWADAKTVPAVAARLAAPAAAAPPPPPGAPPPPAPPPPAALPPIPAGPFQYYDQARAAWVTIDGEELVKIVLALPVGHEGYIFVDGQNLLVQQHPELYRAIQTRRP